MTSDFATYRHLRQCSTTKGLFSVLAIDHRGVLLTDMEKAREKPITRQDVIELKRAIIHHLADEATAVLTDPEYGFAAFTQSGISGGKGLLSPLEVTDYTPHPSQRLTNFIENWDVSKIKSAGGSGVKLLLYFHPDAENAQFQTDLVDSIIEQCKVHRIPFFLEPIGYSLDPQNSLSNEERRQVVIESVRHFTARGIDILKAEFPLDVKQQPDESVWADALDELNSASEVPWTILSAGVTYDIFLRQTILACKAGASGVMVGRAVWAEALPLTGEALQQFLATTGKARMSALTAICNLYGTSWMDKIGSPALAENWFQTF